MSDCYRLNDVHFCDVAGWVEWGAIGVCVLLAAAAVEGVRRCRRDAA